MALSWLLDRPELGLVAHHLPRPEATVEWAHAIEIDDPSPWLRGRGLVLTTGLRLPRTKPGQEEYVARLAAAGTPAIGFGTGMRYAAIPFAVVAACRAHRVALLEVPLPTPFLAVVQAVTDRLAELRRRRLADSMDLQHQLTRAVLRGGLPGLATRLARALRAGVLLAGADGLGIAAAGTSPPTTDQVLAEAGHGGAIRIAEPGRVLEIQPVGVAPGEPLAWLALTRPTPFTTTERLVLTHAVSLATIQMATPADPSLLAVGSSVLAGLVEGRSVPASETLAAWAIDADRISLVGLSGTSTADVQAATRALHRQRPLLDTDWEMVNRRLLLIRTEDTDATLEALPPGVTAAAGEVPTPAAAPTTAALLGRALDTATPGARIRLADSPASRLIHDPALRSATEPWLTALAAYDVAQGAELTASLRAFLSHHGAWDPAAQSLGIHRHTLRHRVDRAAAIAGFDVDDATHRALLTLALQA